MKTKSFELPERKATKIKIMKIFLLQRRLLLLRKIYKMLSKLEFDDKKVIPEEMVYRVQGLLLQLPGHNILPVFRIAKG